MPPPSDLQPHQQAAWDTLEAGGSYKEAATSAGVATGTISKWIKKWRGIHGDDLFRSERSEERAQRTEAAREASQQMWSDLRQIEARNLGITGSQIRRRLLEMLPSVGSARVDRGPDGTGNPMLVKGPDGREVKAMADALARIVEMAELLDDRPTSHSRRSVPADQWINPASGAAAGPGATVDVAMQRVILNDAQLAEQFASIAEAAWARAHPEEAPGDPDR